mmetsp:Transcript_2685/g.5403  ORF Transcript_2685/g.5403 Transcript_2685/m.5403 type:complete len:104 (+) Transcript_2685:173-484(+)
MEKLVSERIRSCPASSAIGEVEGVITARGILKQVAQQGNSDKAKAQALRCEVGAEKTTLRGAATALRLARIPASLHLAPPPPATNACQVRILMWSLSARLPWR